MVVGAEGPYDVVLSQASAGLLTALLPAAVAFQEVTDIVFDSDLLDLREICW